MRLLAQHVPQAAGRTKKGLQRARQPAYAADLTAGALKLPESRVISDLLVRRVSEQQWHAQIYERNVLQARSPATARRLTALIRARLETMQPELWRMVRDGPAPVATQALFAAAIKHSRLLGDFLDLVVRDHYRAFKPVMTNTVWDSYLADCRGRDPEMPAWTESTRRRLRSSVFQILAQVGFLESTRTLRLQAVHIVPQVIRYLERHHEDYVLHCIQVGP